MNKYAVFGNPIAQSKSPIIHQMFALQAELSIDYARILANKDYFAVTLSDFFNSDNALGCNVTAPFKEQAALWVDELSPAAKLAGSVNTITKIKDGVFQGDTTDGTGLVNDLLRLGVELTNKRILLLGAGGAARGVIQSILDLQPSELVLANRTESKAKNLVSLLPQENFVAKGFAELANYDSAYDLVINSTSSSLTQELPDIPADVLANCANVYDLSYADKPTIFLQHAKAMGAINVFDGLGMLVGQAAESFYLWTKFKPDILPVIKALRSQL